MSVKQMAQENLGKWGNDYGSYELRWLSLVAKETTVQQKLHSLFKDRILFSCDDLSAVYRVFYQIWINDWGDTKYLELLRFKMTKFKAVIEDCKKLNKNMKIISK